MNARAVCALGLRVYSKLNVSKCAFHATFHKVYMPADEKGKFKTQIEF